MTRSWKEINTSAMRLKISRKPLYGFFWFFQLVIIVTLSITTLLKSKLFLVSLPGRIVCENVRLSVCLSVSVWVSVSVCLSVMLFTDRSRLAGARQQGEGISCLTLASFSGQFFLSVPSWLVISGGGSFLASISWMDLPGGRTFIPPDTSN